jgi:antitoxin VapB
MSTAHTKVFMSNRSQAIRLPKSVALPEGVKDVVIVAIGDRRIITPAGESWDDWFDRGRVSDDFMRVREQPRDQDREPIE